MKITGRHLLVLVSMCGLLATGVGLVTNVGGLFFKPIADELGVGVGETSLMLTICNISFAVGGLLSPRLAERLNPRLLIIICTAVLAGCTAALTICPSIVAMYALCVGRGFAAGIVGFVFATTVLNGWFVESIGLATSIAMGCSGIAGAAFTPILSGIIEGSGWRMGFMVVALATVVLNLPAICCVPAVNARDAGILPFGAKEEDLASAAPDTSDAAPAQDAPPISAVLFVAVLAYAVLGSAATALPQHFKVMAELYGQAAVGATMVSVCLVANTAGKIALGALIDRIGTKISLLIYTALVCAAAAALLFVHTPVALVVAAAGYGLVYAIATVGISMITRDAFGLANYSKTYPVMSLGGNIANATFTTVVGFMYDFSGGYTSTLIMLIALLVITALCVIFVYAKRPKELAA